MIHLSVRADIASLAELEVSVGAAGVSTCIADCPDALVRFPVVPCPALAGLDLATDTRIRIRIQREAMLVDEEMHCSTRRVDEDRADRLRILVRAICHLEVVDDRGDSKGLT